MDDKKLASHSGSFLGITLYVSLQYRYFFFVLNKDTVSHGKGQESGECARDQVESSGQNRQIREDCLRSIKKNLRRVGGGEK